MLATSFAAFRPSCIEESNGIGIKLRQQGLKMRVIDESGIIACL
jgi:hypothetical protein